MLGFSGAAVGAGSGITVGAGSGVTVGAGSGVTTGVTTGSCTKAGATGRGAGAGTAGTDTGVSSVSRDRCIHIAMTIPASSPTPRLTSATHERERGAVARADALAAAPLTFGCVDMRPPSAPLSIACVRRSAGSGSSAAGATRTTADGPVTGRGPACGAGTDEPRAGACILCPVGRRVPSLIPRSEGGRAVAAIT